MEKQFFQPEARNIAKLPNHTENFQSIFSHIRNKASNVIKALIFCVSLGSTGCFNKEYSMEELVECEKILYTEANKDPQKLNRRCRRILEEVAKKREVITFPALPKNSETEE